jgi:hypothetical protein
MKRPNQALPRMPRSCHVCCLRSTRAIPESSLSLGSLRPLRTFPSTMNSTRREPLSRRWLLTVGAFISAYLFPFAVTGSFECWTCLALASLGSRLALEFPVLPHSHYSSGVASRLSSSFSHCHKRGPCASLHSNGLLVDVYYSLGAFRRLCAMTLDIPSLPNQALQRMLWDAHVSCIRRSPAHPSASLILGA